METTLISYHFGSGNLSINQVEIGFFDRNTVLGKLLSKISNLLGHVFKDLRQVNFKNEVYASKNGKPRLCKVSISRAQLNKLIIKECSNATVTPKSILTKMQPQLQNESCSFNEFADRLVKEINTAKKEPKTEIVKKEEKSKGTALSSEQSEESPEKVKNTTPIQNINCVERTFGSTKIIVKRGDITKEKVDAIVNAANSIMLGGGGVDGAIHNAAGPELLKECSKIPANVEGERCPTGEARITLPGKLPAKWVIHAVGPTGNMNNRDILLRNTHINSLKIASDLNLKTITFPAISVGIF